MNENKWPSWLKRPLQDGKEFKEMKANLRSAGLHTVCESAKCPNIGECFSQRTATFMIGGNVCTRSCKFCNVHSGKPDELDSKEALKIAQAAKKLNLAYVVVTSVTRDDLPDGGANHFKQVAQQLRLAIPDVKIEFLIPDFCGNEDSLQIVIDSAPDVLNHNLETIERLSPLIRSGADYNRSLNLLKKSKDLGAKRTKTGIMLGLGETYDEILKVFEDAHKSKCDIFTIGQYLRPEAECIEVQKFYTPTEFEDLKTLALAKGLQRVVSGPYVRSSYHASAISS